MDRFKQLEVKHPDGNTVSFVGTVVQNQDKTWTASVPDVPLVRVTANDADSAYKLAVEGVEKALSDMRAKGQTLPKARQLNEVMAGTQPTQT